jgi:hypothetical protein
VEHPVVHPPANGISRHGTNRNTDGWYGFGVKQDRSSGGQVR